MVLAFAGDSTTTSAFAIDLCDPSMPAPFDPSPFFHPSTSCQIGRIGRRPRGARVPAVPARTTAAATARAAGRIARQSRPDRTVPRRPDSQNGVGRRSGLAPFDGGWRHGGQSRAPPGYRPRSPQSLHRPAERVAAAVSAAQDVAGNGQHVAPLFERAAGGNERAALLARFDHDDRPRQAADDPVAQRKEERQRRRPRRELADERASLRRSRARAPMCSGG